MSALPAHEITQEFHCKIDGCDKPARLNRGAFAYLCDYHRAQHPRSRGGTVTHLRPTPPSASAEGFEAKARGLAAVGKKLDQAVSAYKRKQASIEPAKQALDAAMREWRQACRDLAGDA